MSSRLTVLIIDADRGARRAFARAVERAGGSATEIDDVAGGFEALERQTFDFVVCEEQAVSDAVRAKLVERARELRATTRILLVLNANWERREELWAGATVSWIRKPHAPHQVAEILAAHAPGQPRET